MTLPELKDSTERFLGGMGVTTDENRWDGLYIESLIHKYSRAAIISQFSKVKRINPLWVQSFNLEFSEDQQESDCLVVFDVPEYIQLDQIRSGLIYVGTTEMNCRYRQVMTRDQLASANIHRYINPKTVRVLYSGGTLEVYGNPMLQEMRVDIIAQNPCMVPTYNKLKDDYPFNDDLAPLMQQLLWATEGQQLLAGSIDGKSDGGDNNATTSR